MHPYSTGMVAIRLVQQIMANNLLHPRLIEMLPLRNQLGIIKIDNHWVIVIRPHVLQ